MRTATAPLPGGIRRRRPRAAAGRATHHPGQCVAPLSGHGVCRRVVQRRGEHHEGRSTMCLSLKGIGAHPVGVAGDRLDRQAEHPRHRPHAGIAERLDEDPPLRAPKRHQGEQDGMVGTVGEHHVVSVHLEAAPRQPSRPRSTVGGTAPEFGIAQQLLGPTSAKQRGGGFLQQPRQRRPGGLRRQVECQVDHRRLQRTRIVADERPPALLGSHQPAALRLGDRPGHRGQVELQHRGEPALGRQALATVQCPVGHTLGDGVDQRDIPRS